MWTPAYDLRNGKPYTPEELLDMKKAGEPVSKIMQRAKRVNGWGKAKVRGILFDDEKIG